VQGSKGVAEAVIKLEKPEQIKYLKFEITFGSGLQGESTVLEFIGMTELQAYYEKDNTEIDPLELTSASKLRIENGFLLGLPDKVTVDKIKSNFKRE
jgi:hypothetical protein